MPLPRDQPQQEARGIPRPRGHQEEVAYQSGALQEERESIRQWGWVVWVKGEERVWGARQRAKGCRRGPDAAQTSVIFTSQ